MSGEKKEKEKGRDSRAAAIQAPDTQANLAANSVPDELLQQANAVATNNTEEQHNFSGTNLSSPIPDLPPPPAYSESVTGEIDINQDGINTGARVAQDGRVDIKIDHLNQRLTRMLTRQLTISEQRPSEDPYIPLSLAGTEGSSCPPLNVVIQVVGSRGDVQPFIALGQVLKKKYGHRVRLATHPVFREFVTENGLEFFSIGGDPADLMAYMVKNPGLMPGMETLKSGEIGKKRRSIYEMMVGSWRSCIEPGDGSGPPAADENLTSTTSIDSLASIADPAQRPFVADAIIANPPSFAHIHIAERLGIPLHLMFTMPWSPTQAYPHPLANIKSSSSNIPMANFLSYILVDMLTWQGTGDIFNRFREKVLRLEPISAVWAPGGLHRLRIPWTYAWSPALIPKPVDWPAFIDIAGFYFLDLASNYVPDAELAQFLAAGPPPVYIGFGSIVVDDPNAMTKLIFEAVALTGQRALVSKGWGGLAAGELGLPDNIFMLGNCPHDWLFERVSAVVHHGGAGTTAAGVKAGRPTVVVPFFGDQPFWGSMVNRAGAGPKPVAYKELTAQKLADSIMEALKPESLDKAAELSTKIKNESGPDVGAKSFHRFLNLDKMRCALDPNRVAVWRIKRTSIGLSALAATVLANAGLLEFADLKLFRHREYEVDTGPPEPIIGGATAIMGTISGMTASIADFPTEVLKSFRQASDDAMKKPKERPDGQKSPHAPSPPVSQTASTTDLSSKTGRGDTATASMTGPSRASTMSLDSTNSSDQGQPDVSTPTSEQASSIRTRTTDASASEHAASGTATRDHTPKPSSRKNFHQRCPSSQQAGAITLESAIGSAKAASSIVGIGLKSPLDFTMSLAKGFHNTPLLYHDKTVRPMEKVTGFQSGLRAAGRNLALGFMDGIGGLVTQPMEGFKEEGGAGLVKGLVKGSLGLVFKPGAAIWGLPAYTMQGIYAEISKNFGKNTTNYIIAARMAQGYEDYQNSTDSQRESIVAKWQSGNIQQKYLHKKGPKEQGDSATILTTGTKDRLVNENGELLTGFRNTKHLTWEERKELARRKEALQQNVHLSSVPRSEPAVQTSHTNPLAVTSEDEFRDAIRMAVERTSQNDARQDRVIENAIWASVRELQRHPPAESSKVAEAASDDQEDQVYARAVAASVAEYKRLQGEPTSGQQSGVVGKADGHRLSVDDDFDDELTRALTASMMEYTRGTESQLDSMHTPSPGTDEDEDYKRAVAESMRNPSGKSDMGSKKSAGPVLPPRYEAHTDASASRVAQRVGPTDDNNEDSDLQEALRLSQLSSQEHAANLDRQKTEEDIVLEYIKKQSLQEEEYRRRQQQR